MRAAKVGLEAFLELVVSMRVLPRADADALGVTAVLSAALATRDADSAVSSGAVAVLGGGPRADPATLRAQKIARFKANTAAKAQLRELALANARRALLAARAGAEEDYDGVGACLAALR